MERLIAEDRHVDIATLIKSVPSWLKVLRKCPFLMSHPLTKS